MMKKLTFQIFLSFTSIFLLAACNNAAVFNELDSEVEGAEKPEYNYRDAERVESIDPEKDGWVEYVSDEYGFSFHYPTEFNGMDIGVDVVDSGFEIVSEGDDKKAFHLPIVVDANVESEKDLLAFIQKKYGETCTIDRIKYDEGALAPVWIKTTGIEGGCWINWRIALWYSPINKIVIAMDFGQKSPLAKSIFSGEVDYTYAFIDRVKLN